MKRPRTFSRKPSRASKDAAAIQYVVSARNPTADSLTRLFGIKPAKAEQMIADETARRANGSASAELRGIFG